MSFSHRKMNIALNKTEVFFQKHILKLLALLLAVTFIAYFPSLKNNFTKWDDSKYVLENPQVKSLSLENIKSMFTSSYQGNYAPLTFLSFSLNYRISSESPQGYLLTNILLHLCNILLVYLFIAMLTQNSLMGFLTALLFALNPIHTESVVWIAERKDVLYTFFFFSSLHSYVNYSLKKKSKYYLFAVLFFILACLSKSAAISLAVLPFIIDHFLGNKILERRRFVEKIPFLFIGFMFLMIGMQSVKTGANLLSSYDLNLAERTAIASYDLIHYFLKIIFPINLSAYYPYPFSPGENLPAYLWIYPLISITMIPMIFFLFRKNKYITFGILFFLINIFLALQFFPVGNAIIADRFTYVAASGIYFLDAYGIYSLVRQNRSLVAGGIVIVTIFLFAGGVRERCRVWSDDETLWSDVILKNENVPIAYLNRGTYYFSKGKNNEAIEDLSEAISKRKNYKEAYYNRGVAYLSVLKYDSAETDFSSALKTDTQNPDAIFNRALCRSVLNRLELADKDFSDFLRIKPNISDAYSERGLVRYKLKRINEAMGDYNKAIELDPKQPDAYARRGIIHLEKGDTLSACNDFHKADDLGLRTVEGIIKANCK